MNGFRHPPLAAALLIGAAIGVTACGGSDSPAPPKPPQAAKAAKAAASAATAVNPLDPPVGGREILRIRRIGYYMGASDIIKFGSDGSAVIIQAYGGGGERIRKCRLDPGVLAQIRRAARMLPLGKPVHVKRRARPTFYTAPAAQYTLWAGRESDAFTADAVPPGASRFERAVQDTMRGRIASCHETFRTRKI